MGRLHHMFNTLLEFNGLNLIKILLLVILNLSIGLMLANHVTMTTL